MWGCPPPSHRDSRAPKRPAQRPAREASSASTSNFRRRLHVELARIPPRSSGRPCTSRAARNFLARFSHTPKTRCARPRTPMRPRWSSSPPETMSKPAAAPAAPAASESTKLPFAFTAKHSRCGIRPQPLSSSSNAFFDGPAAVHVRWRPETLGNLRQHHTLATHPLWPRRELFHAKCGVNRRRVHVLQILPGLLRIASFHFGDDQRAVVGKRRRPA